MSSVAQPDGYNKSFSDVNAPGANHAPAEMSLDAKIDVKFPMTYGGTMPETQFKGDPNPDAVMTFKNSSSNAEDMALPLGRSYGEFDQADDSIPNEKVTTVDARTIMKGNQSTAEETGGNVKL